MWDQIEKRRKSRDTSYISKHRLYKAKRILKSTSAHQQLETVLNLRLLDIYIKDGARMVVEIW